jgi:chromosome segregation ATPase
LLYEDIEIPLEGGISVLTGRNGSGKSLFLDAVRLGLGLDSRNIRMERIDEYLRDETKNAEITITFNNPIIDKEERLFRCSNPAISKLLFSADQIIIKRVIQPKGKGTEYQIYDKSYKKLPTEQKNALLEALANIGINPQDELAFVPAEDFLNFMGQTGNERFKIFKRKIGLKESEEKYQKTRDRIRISQAEAGEIDLKSVHVMNSLQKMKDSYDKWTKKQELLRKVEELNEKKEWAVYSKIKDELESNKQELVKKGEKKTKLIPDLNKQKANAAALETKFKSAEAAFNQADTTQKDLTAQKNKLSGAASSDNAKRDQKVNEKVNLDAQVTKMKADIAILNREVAALDTGAMDVHEEVQSLDKRIQELQDKVGDLNGDNEKIENDIKELRSSLRKKFDAQIKDIEDQIEALNDQINDIQRSEASKGDKSRQEAEKTRDLILINDFIGAMRNAGIKRENYIGPIFNELKVAPGEEKWAEAISAGLKGVLDHFLALDEETYKKMHEITQDKDLKRIRIGAWYTKRVKQQAYEDSMDSHEILMLRKQQPEIYNSISALVTGNKHAIAYARMYSGLDTIILDTTDRVRAQRIAEDLRGQNLRFLTKNCIPISVRAEGTQLGSSNIFVSIQVGDGLSISSKEMKQRIDKIKEQIRTLQAQQSDLFGLKQKLELDDGIMALKKAMNENFKRIGALEAEKLNLEQQRVEKDPVALRKLKRESILAKENEIKTDESKISDIVKEINRYEQSSAKVNSQIEAIDVNLRATTADRKDKQNARDAASKEYKGAEAAVEKADAGIKDVDKDIKKLEGEIKTQDGKFQDLSKKFKGKQQPAKMETEDRISGQIDSTLELIEEYKGISDSIRDEYEQKQKLLKDFDGEKVKLQENIARLVKESAEWESQIKKTLDDKLEKINQAFNKVLGVINASGSIDVKNPEDPDKTSLGIFVKYAGEEFRSLEQHSSGQKQAAIIALVIAMQTETLSPITAIDEFDKGLDPINKRNIIEKIPLMIQEGLASKVSAYLQKIQQQCLIILPELIGEALPPNINYLTCVRSGNLSGINKK